MQELHQLFSMFCTVFFRLLISRAFLDVRVRAITANIKADNPVIKIINANNSNNKTTIDMVFHPVSEFK